MSWCSQAGSTGRSSIKAATASTLSGRQRRRSRRRASGRCRRGANAAGGWRRPRRRASHRPPAEPVILIRRSRKRSRSMVPWSAQWRSSMTSTDGVSRSCSNTAVKISCGCVARAEHRDDVVAELGREVVERVRAGGGSSEGRTRPRAPACRRTQSSVNACRSVLLPAPDSPLTSAMPPRPSRARRSVAASTASSSSRSSNLTGGMRTEAPAHGRACGYPSLEAGEARIGRWGAPPDAPRAPIAESASRSSADRPAEHPSRQQQENIHHEDVHHRA